MVSSWPPPPWLRPKPRAFRWSRPGLVGVPGLCNLAQHRSQRPGRQERAHSTLQVASAQCLWNTATAQQGGSQDWAQEWVLGHGVPPQEGRGPAARPSASVPFAPHSGRRWSPSSPPQNSVFPRGPPQATSGHPRHHACFPLCSQTRPPPERPQTQLDAAPARHAL